MTKLSSEYGVQRHHIRQWRQKFVDEFLSYSDGGERGIRTPVRAFGPQIDFESIPLRPLRYLSG